MEKKDKVFKFVAAGLGVALVVAGILFALRTSGIQEAADPNNAAVANNESFAIDPDNLPDGVQIMRDGQAPEGADASSNAASSSSSSSNMGSASAKATV